MAPPQGTPQSTPQSTSPQMTFDAAPVAVDTMAGSLQQGGGGMTFDSQPVTEDTPTLGATPLMNTNAGLAPASNNSQPVAMDDPTAGLPGGSVNPQPATPGMTKAAEIGIGTAATAVGVMETHALIAAGVRALAPALTAGAKGLTAWAAEHPMASRAIFHAIKWAIQGTAVGAGSKIVGKIIDAAPNQ
jgi:hypothetical protein